MLSLGLLLLVWGAANSRRVVVAAFSAPSGLAASGVTGEVVATDMLDDLKRLQDKTRSGEKALDTASAWAGDIRIDLPHAGVSIGEIDRVLHERLGHDLHVGGDLVQTASGGLALTVRGDGVPAQTFEGTPSELATITMHAAEYVYGRAQPHRFALYLEGAGRYEDALAFLPDAFIRAESNAVRAELATSWGNIFDDQGKAPQAREKYHLAMALLPNNWKAWSNLIDTYDSEEAVVKEADAFLRAASAVPADQQPAKRFLAAAALARQDLPLALEAESDSARFNNGAGTNTVLIQPQIADVNGLMHDTQAAERAMVLSDPDDSYTKAEALALSGYKEVDRGDPAAALTALESFWKLWTAERNLQTIMVDTPCFAGLAFGFAGRLADADKVFTRIGSLSRCYAYRGAVLEHAGDLAGAERVWAQGISEGPDLPLVFLERGRSEMRRGNFPAAEADFSRANANSPHFADPLKAWGDALSKQGNWPGARAKYEEALKYAPNWEALKQAQNVAISKF
jgi:tetratricopeptide (TPR) repeat protein